MLSEMRQTQKDKYCMISHMCGNKKVQLIEIDTRMVVARDLWGKG